MMLCTWYAINNVCNEKPRRVKQVWTDVEEKVPYHKLNGTSSHMC